MGPSNMEWFEEVSLKYKRKNQILFSKECELFQDLSYIITVSYTHLTLPTT